MQLPEGLPVQGVVLSDHVKNADSRERRAERIGAVSPKLEAVRMTLKPLLGT